MTIQDTHVAEGPRQARSAAIKLAAAWIVLPLSLLAAGGSLAWWNAWVYCAIILVPMTPFVVWMIGHDPDFIARRSKYREKEGSQRRILAWALPFQLAIFVVPALDYRLGWSRPPLAAVLTAVAVALLGYVGVLRVFAENRWAGRTVEIYPGQTVIASGPYAILRHPMYAASLALYVATPVALGSWWGALPALAFVPVFVLRIRGEEEVLVRDLAGYREYRLRVRWRLVPFIW